LGPLAPLTQFGLHDVAVLSERWADAETILKKLSAAAAPFARLGAANLLGADAILRGRLAEGIRAIERGAAGEGPPGSRESAISRNFAARMLMNAGQPARAVELAQRALKDSAGRGPEWESLALIAEAQARLGRAGEAAQALETLSAQANLLPSER